MDAMVNCNPKEFTQYMKALKYKASKEKVRGNYTSCLYYKSFGDTTVTMNHAYQTNCQVTVFFEVTGAPVVYDTLLSQFMHKGFKRNKDSSDVLVNMYYSPQYPNFEINQSTTQDYYRRVFISYYPTGKHCHIVYDW